MVGSHSRGCLRCVQRRKKCDGARPYCGNCARINEPCPGYTRPLRFMPIASNQLSTSDGCTYCALRGVPCDGKLPICTRCITFKLGCNLAERGRRSHSSDSDAQASQNRNIVHATGLSSDPAIPLGPIRTVFATNTSNTRCIIFLNKHFDYGPPNNETEQIKLWILQALQAPSDHPVSGSAVQSTIDGFFGNLQNDAQLRRQALISYSASIRNVREFFSTPRTTVPFDILSAVVLLRISEGCLSKTNAGWLSHTRGMKKLIELQGPSYFRAQPARSLLLWTRHALFVEAMISGKRSFLEAKEWQGILQSTDEILGRMLRLGDTGICLPGLVEDVNSLVEDDTLTTAQMHNKIQTSIISLTNHGQVLNSWWQDWSSDEKRVPERLSRDKDAANPVWSMLPVSLPPPLSGIEGSTMLLFQTLDIAVGFSLYHALSIIVLSLLDKLDKIKANLSSSNPLPSPPTNDLDIPIVPPDRVQAMLSHALAIVEAIPYYCLPQYRHSGAMYMCVPAHVAWQVFSALSRSPSQHAAQADRFSKWLKQMLTVTAKNSGFPVVEDMLRSDGGWSI